MMMQLYVVVDVLAEESGPIFEAKNNKVARRQYNNMMSGNMDPSEYKLLNVGWIDHETHQNFGRDPEDVTKEKLKEVVEE